MPASGPSTHAMKPWTVRALHRKVTGVSTGKSVLPDTSTPCADRSSTLTWTRSRSLSIVAVSLTFDRADRRSSGLLCVIRSRVPRTVMSAMGGKRACASWLNARFRLDGQCEGDTCSSLWSVLSPNPASVSLDDRATNAKPQAHSIVFT